VRVRPVSSPSIGAIRAEVGVCPPVVAAFCDLTERASAVRPAAAMGSTVFDLAHDLPAILQPR
jgi:hypothetical protein